jgi:hypothetical protein
MIVSFFTTYDETDELYTLRIDLGFVIYRFYINGALHIPEFTKTFDKMTLTCHDWSIHIDSRSVSVKTVECESNIILSQSTIEMLKYELVQVMNRIYQYDTPHHNVLDYLYTNTNEYKSDEYKSNEYKVNEYHDVHGEVSDIPVLNNDSFDQSQSSNQVSIQSSANHPSTQSSNQVSIQPSANHPSTQSSNQVSIQPSSNQVSIQSSDYMNQ